MSGHTMSLPPLDREPLLTHAHTSGQGSWLHDRIPAQRLSDTNLLLEHRPVPPLPLFHRGFRHNTELGHLHLEQVLARSLVRSGSQLDHVPHIHRLEWHSPPPLFELAAVPSDTWRSSPIGGSDRAISSPPH